MTGGLAMLVACGECNGTGERAVKLATSQQMAELIAGHITSDDIAPCYQVCPRCGGLGLERVVRVEQDTEGEG